LRLPPSSVDPGYPATEQSVEKWDWNQPADLAANDDVVRCLSHFFNTLRAVRLPLVEKHSMSGSKRLNGFARVFAALLFAAAPSLCFAVDPIDFSRDVRPILSDKCFFCHGPDEKHREAELRAGLRESADRHEAPRLTSIE